MVISLLCHRFEHLFTHSTFTLSEVKPIATRLYQTLYSECREHKISKIFCSTDLGIHQIFFYCVQKLKKDFPNIHVSLLIPYSQVLAVWEEKQKISLNSGDYATHKNLETSIKRYPEMISLADDIIYTDVLPQFNKTTHSNFIVGLPHQSKYIARNLYSIENSDIILAVFDGKRKGTTNQSVRLAELYNKNIIRLDPNQNYCESDTKFQSDSIN